MEAVRQFESQSGEISALITDLAMPGMDGIAAIESMTRSRPDLKVIAMSGYSVTSQPGGAELPPQVRAIIDKPYTPEILLRTLRRVLDTP
jgi:CheY-like chemotaxis protein